ncbi:MAG: divergent polysaccharide deacetylase family protein [Treponemataceae bacterium]|nr:divergent polysaccharide deacetylase family protein [Treponemataceae bacterium]
MEQKRTNKTTSTSPSQSNSKTSAKKTTARKSKKTVSSNTALFLSVAVLALCVVMLGVSFVLTQKNSPQTIVKSESQSVKKTTEQKSNVEKSTNVTSVKTETRQSSKNTSSQTSNQTKQSVQNTQITKNQNTNNLQVAKSSATSKTTNTMQSTNSVQSTKNSEPVVQISTPKVPAKKVADVYIVLDDGGHNLNHLQPFLNLDIPLTIAVLPELAYSKESALRIKNSGKTLILHQPMQAISLSTDPGPSAIMPGMSAEQIRNLLTKNLDSLGIKIGLNNHEGSLITADSNAMKVVMEICKEREMFFLDSRTNSQSVCKSVASEYGVKLYERNIFLDNTPNQADMIAMFKSGIEVAKKNGCVIMIGHVWSSKNLADVLQKMYDEYYPQGFIFGELK